jgi:hypothetical protein
MLEKGAGNVLQLTHIHTCASLVTNMFIAHENSAGEIEGPISCVLSI